MIYFYTPCKKCIEIEKNIIPFIPKDINIIYADVLDKKILKNLLRLSNYKKISVPSIYYRNKLYTYKDIKKTLLDDLNNPKNYNQNKLLYDDSNISIKKLFLKFNIFILIIAGLIDGLNPCAFVTMLFLLSYLSSLKVLNIKLVVIGIFFILGVFLSYIFTGLLGFKFLQIIYKTKLYFIFENILLILIASMFFASLMDIYLAFFNSNNKFVLSLNNKFILYIHSIIKKFLSNINISKNKIILIMLSFFTGFLISIIELACTGQIYLPVLKIIFKESGGLMKIKSLLYILFYNFSFIIPLILLLISFIYLDKKLIISKVKTNSKINRILISILFLILFVYLI